MIFSHRNWAPSLGPFWLELGGARSLVGWRVITLCDLILQGASVALSCERKELYRLPFNLTETLVMIERLVVTIRPKLLCVDCILCFV